MCFINGVITQKETNPVIPHSPPPRPVQTMSTTKHFTEILTWPNTMCQVMKNLQMISWS